MESLVKDAGQSALAQIALAAATRIPATKTSGSTSVTTTATPTYTPQILNKALIASPFPVIRKSSGLRRMYNDSWYGIGPAWEDVEITLAGAATGADEINSSLPTDPWQIKIAYYVGRNATYEEILATWQKGDRPGFAFIHNPSNFTYKEDSPFAVPISVVLTEVYLDFNEAWNLATRTEGPPAVPTAIALLAYQHLFNTTYHFRLQPYYGIRYINQTVPLVVGASDGCINATCKFDI